MKLPRLIMGILCWVAIAVTGWLAIQRELKPRGHTVGSLTSGVGEWVIGRNQRYTAVSPATIALANGDPVLIRKSDGTYRQIGVVRDNHASSVIEPITKSAEVVLYDDAVAEFPTGFELHYFASPTSLDWVASTLISPERQKEIAALIAADWQRHQAEVLRNLTPIVQGTLQRMIVAVEAELPKVMARHRHEFSELGERYKTEIIQKQLLPLAREKILPIVEEEARPLAAEIGQSLWNRVSLWSFTWRYFYDVSPLPERNAVQSEFDRFLEKEAIPELKSRSPQFVALTEKILNRVNSDPAVSGTIRRSLRQISSDPKLHAVVWGVIRDAVLNNAALRQSIEDYWDSDETRRAMNIATIRFEPTARAIGDLVLGSKEKGMPPEFTRILRLQILQKDRHWLVLEPVKSMDKAAVRIRISPVQMMYPIQFEGSVGSPLTKLQ